MEVTRYYASGRTTVTTYHKLNSTDKGLPCYFQKWEPVTKKPNKKDTAVIALQKTNEINQHQKEQDLRRSLDHLIPWTPIEGLIVTHAGHGQRIGQDNQEATKPFVHKSHFRVQGTVNPLIAIIQSIDIKTLQLKNQTYLVMTNNLHPSNIQQHTSWQKPKYTLASTNYPRGTIAQRLNILLQAVFVI